MLQPATEVFLSYLIGLGPIGHPVEPRIDWIMADLSYCQHVSIYKHLRRLIQAGYVDKIGPGRKGALGLLIVARRPVRRPEPIVIPITRHLPNRVEAGRVAHEHWLSKLVEIPADTRSLTGRVCGDPLPGRSALDRRATA
jgi:hypothetical protein